MITPDLGEVCGSAIRRYAGKFRVAEFSYGTVQDYCDSYEHLNPVTAVQGDLKDQQRPWMVKAILGLVPPGSSVGPVRLLEIGAGEPLVAGLFGELGYEVTVVDPYDGSGNGPTAYETYVKSYPDVRIHRCNFGVDTCNFLDPAWFHCIYSISVLEHLRGHELASVYEAIEHFLSVGGYSIHCVDHVVEGQGSQFHEKQVKEILRYQKAIHGIIDPHVDEEYDIVMNQLMGDLETLYLSASGHNLWRQGRSYETFPFRKVVSMQYGVVKNKDLISC